jgi:predicted transcriptional regulator
MHALLGVNGLEIDGSAIPTPKECNTMIKLGDIMSRHVESVGPDDTLGEAVRRMDVLNASMLPVCEGGRVLGAVTRRLAEQTRAVKHTPSSRLPVRQVMRRNVLCGRDTQDVKDALRQMREKRVGALPVLDATDRLVGIFRLGL